MWAWKSEKAEIPGGKWCQQFLPGKVAKWYFIPKKQNWSLKICDGIFRWLKELFLHCMAEFNGLGPSWMGLTHGNVIFDILEPSAFQKYSICWVFRAFFCSTFFYMYFATRPRPALTAVIEMLDWAPTQWFWRQCERLSSPHFPAWSYGVRGN